MRRARLATFVAATVLGAGATVTVLGATACTKGTGPEIDAATKPGDARGSGDAHGLGDAGSGAPHDAGPTDAAGSDAMPQLPAGG